MFNKLSGIKWGIIVRPNYSILECAALMLNAPKMVHLLPIVDESERFLGITPPLNLIKEIA